MRILILGASGLTGSRLAELAIEKGHEVIGTYRSRPVVNSSISEGYTKLDIADVLGTVKLIRETCPDVVVNVINVPGVDYCERHPVEASVVQAVSMLYVGYECKRIGAKLIYTSTDYVFDGTKLEPYTEEDLVNPLNVYARTKVEGEHIVRSLGIRYNIVRPSLIYGNPEKSRFLGWVLDSLKKGKTVKPFIDQFSCPTFVDDLAQAILILAESDIQGTFHTVGSSCVSRYEYASMIAEVFGFNKDLIEKASLDDFMFDGVRPRHLWLSNNWFQETFGYRFSTLEEGLRKVKEKYWRDE